ncbi:alpha/beta fold hydrolase [Mycolicibacterium mucogenicum]|uniref:Alpha/beta hydrolase n=1 Tax=Mycolicibacterium mucogenicum DSM 44124 TaxID=1226753 RepID=A0A8H2JDU4_MYCMU|nr:alpha/beta hydrolase [Mycolicibacterium mucogenicum]KAB7751151.1 alpha/beta hydrolase [Mycolicibacterium mucogenicum DSM 44124]QPG66933.1 alpha/beta hydrolase [Mycolicibacterium mucogenicum DSM 44124]
MTTFLLVPGGGCDPSYWRFVVRELAVRGHRGIAVDLPCDDDAADLNTYADVVAAQRLDDGEPPVVVAHSFGGFTGALACPRVGAAELVYVSAMVPRPGERPGDWWSATGCVAAQREAAAVGGYDIDDAVALYYNGVDLAVVAEEIERAQSETPSLKPWPAEALPQVPTRFILFRDDRFFPEGFMRRVVADRLGIEPEVMPGGHMAILSHPVELVDLLTKSR